MATADGDKDMEIYTTRPDTLFGTTFAVVSPEHHLLENVPAEWPADVPKTGRALCQPGRGGEDLPSGRRSQDRQGPRERGR